MLPWRLQIVTFEGGKPLGLGLRTRPGWVAAEPADSGGREDYASDIGRFNGPAGAALEATGQVSVGDVVAAVESAGTAGLPHAQIVSLIKQAAVAGPSFTISFLRAPRDAGS